MEISIFRVDVASCYTKLSATREGIGKIMTITNDNLLKTIEHWLNTPENGYFGSSYGGANIAASAINGLVN